MLKEKKEKVKTSKEFEELQNGVGFFSTLLETVLENPELRKKIFSENNKKND